MLIPKIIYVKDFLSFKEATIEIQNGITTCIMGRNFSDKGQLSNGSGKSALQSAIEFSYTGNVSRKVTKNKLVRRGCKQAIVIHKVFNNIKNELLTIERYLPVNGSERILVFITKEGVRSEIELATTRDANNWIINYVGISKEDLSNYFIPNEISYTSFFNNSDANNKALISRFSNADIIDSVFGEIDNDITDFDTGITEKGRELLKVETKIETRQEDLQKELDKDFELEKLETIKPLREKIKKYHDEILANSSKLGEINDRTMNLREILIPQKEDLLVTHKEKLKKFKSISYTEKITNTSERLSKVKTNLKSSNKTEDEIDEDLRSANSDISKMNNVISGGVECPKCKYKFNPDSSITVEKAIENIELYKEEIIIFQSDLEGVLKLKEKFKNETTLLVNKISDLEGLEEQQSEDKGKINDTITETSNDLKKLLNKVGSIKNEIIDFKELNQKTESLIKVYEGKIKDVQESERDNTNKINLSSEIKELKTKEDTLNSEILVLTESQDKIKEWEVNFKLFKSYLANKKLRVIQDITNKFLDEMGSDLKLKLEGYKQLRDGSVREKITPYIYDNGDICSYGEFSKGERARIDFATLLTLQTLVNENCEKGGLDLLFADEIIEGTDSLGLSNLLESFNKTKKTSLLTTHVTNENIYPHILMVEKINKISSIKVN